MKASGQISDVEFAVEDVVRTTIVEAFKADAEDDARMMKVITDFAMKLADSEREKGELQHELADSRVENVKLLNENELLRDDLERYRKDEGLFMATAVGEA